MVVYSSQAQSFVWEGYGLKLSIPDSCLPAGVKNCIINIKASLNGEYEFPENCYLAGAVFWLRCETVRRFNTPITIEIQHCAKLEHDGLKMEFVRATCRQKQLPYTFKSIGGTFSIRSSYGIVDVTSFSGFAPIIRALLYGELKPSPRQYCSKLFYHNSHESHIDIHLAITWDDEAHLTVSEVIPTSFAL